MLHVVMEPKTMKITRRFCVNNSSSQKMIMGCVYVSRDVLVSLEIVAKVAEVACFPLLPLPDRPRAAGTGLGRLPSSTSLSVSLYVVVQRTGGAFRYSDSFTQERSWSAVKIFLQETGRVVLFFP